MTGLAAEDCVSIPLRCRQCGSALASSWTRSTSVRFQSCRPMFRSNTPPETLVSFSTADSLWPTMSLHAVCRSGYYQLRQLRPVVRSLSADGAKAVVHAFISCRLDYCNSLLTGATDCLLRLLQSLQNAAACLVTGAPRREHITPILRHLHWLPVRQRVRYKLATLAFRSLSGQAPASTIASLFLNPDGGHSDQRNDPSASYIAATTPSATDHSQ